MIRLVVLVGLASVAALVPRAEATIRVAEPPVAQAESGADPGSVAYRSGDVDAARDAWLGALEASRGSSDDERARLAYNLGVAAFAEGEPLRAVAWFTASLRYAPRHADAAHNLDLARAEAGLEPAGTDDITGAAVRFTEAFTRSEAGWLAASGALVLLLAGLVEAFRGGAWMRVFLGALALQVVTLAPLVRHTLEPSGVPVMIVASEGAVVHAVPLVTGERLGELAAGDVARAVDALDGWTKVRFNGEERWVRSDAVLPLRWPANLGGVAPDAEAASRAD